MWCVISGGQGNGTRVTRIKEEKMAKVLAGANLQARVQFGFGTRSRCFNNSAQRSSAGPPHRASRNGAFDASICSKSSNFSGGNSASLYSKRSSVVIKSSGARRAQTVAAAVSDMKERKNIPRMCRVWIGKMCLFLLLLLLSWLSD